MPAARASAAADVPRAAGVPRVAVAVAEGAGAGAEAGRVAVRAESGKFGERQEGPDEESGPFSFLA